MNGRTLKKLGSLSTISLVLFLIQPAVSQEIDRYSDVPAKYDLNGNGRLDTDQGEDGTPHPKSELAIYLLHQRSAILQTYDIDLNGEVSGSEIRKLNETARENIVDDLEDARDFLCKDSVIKIQGCLKPREILIATSTPSPQQENRLTDTRVTNGLFIRNAYSAISILSEVPKRDANSLRTVTPATLSYIRDNQAGSDQLSISGAVSKFRRWSYRGEKKPLPNLQASSISGGVVFDRTISSAENANETDVLALRFDVDTVFQGLPLFDTQFLTFTSTITSDFDLDTAILTAGLRWQPVQNSLAIGVSNHFKIDNLPFSFRWQPSIEMEYQNIADDGGQEQLQEAGDFLFIGPLLNAQLFFDFKPFNGAFLNVDYRFMEDALDNTESFDYLELSANFPLDAANHYLLNFRFREGNLPTTRQEVDDFLIGIGVRF